VLPEEGQQMVLLPVCKQLLNRSVHDFSFPGIENRAVGRGFRIPV
jgi:hypothetical protein